MRNILLIGHNGIRLFLRTKVGYVWLFVVPFVFVYFTGVGFRESGSPSNPKPSVLIENQDHGFLGDLFKDELNAQGMNVVGEEKRSEAERGIRIPTNFTEKVLQQKQSKLEFFKTEGSDAEAAAMIELRLARAVIALNSHLLELATQTNSLAPLSEAGLRSMMAKTNPVSLNSKFAGRKPVPAGFNQSLPGTLVMFLMMNLLIFGGVSVSWERTNGVLKRLAVYPIRKWELVVGKVYGRFLLGLVQIIFLLFAGRVVFKVNIGDNIVGLLVTLGLYAWVAASLGVLIGSVVANPDKTVGLCVLSSIIMAALGGCWWPLEIVPDSMKLVGHFFPSAWTMDALHQLISFGGGIETILPKLGVLALFATAANFGAAKFFHC